MSACKFCEAMKVNRQIEEVNRSWATNEEIKRYGKHMIEYTVAIVKWILSVLLRVSNGTKQWTHDRLLSELRSGYARYEK